MAVKVKLSGDETFWEYVGDYTIPEDANKAVQLVPHEITSTNLYVFKSGEEFVLFKPEELGPKLIKEMKENLELVNSYA